MASAPSPPPSANSELASQIVSALLADEFITASEKEAATTLLSTGNAKAGDWRRLLEKNLSAPSTTTDHATPHYAA